MSEKEFVKILFEASNFTTEVSAGAYKHRFNKDLFDAVDENWSINESLKYIERGNVERGIQTGREMGRNDALCEVEKFIFTLKYNNQ